MKKIFWILAAVAATLTSCADDLRDNGNGSGEEGTARFSFAVNVPSARNLTRGWSASDDTGNDSKTC